MKKFIVLSLSIAGLSLASCNKEPGEGGTSRIVGYVEETSLSNSGTVLEIAGGKDLDVYIIYGNEDSLMDDRTKTSFNGGFEFKNLTPGDYTVYAYSEYKPFSSPSSELDSVVMKTISITDKDQTVNVGTLSVKHYH